MTESSTLSSWRTLAIFLANLLACIGIAMASWTMNQVIMLSKEVAEVKAKAPSDYPPVWFQEQYRRDQTEQKAELAEIKKQLMENHDLLLRSSKR